MAQAPSQSPPPELRRLAEQLESFRERTPRPRRLPEPLWNRAAGLAREHGVNAVARALRLNYYALKRRVSSVPPGPSKPTAPSFVAIGVPPSGSDSPSVLELEDGTGRKLTVTLGARAGLDLRALVAAFWEAGQ